MQSTQNGFTDNGDKNLAEWPTLSDVSGNVKVPHQKVNSVKYSQCDVKRDNSPAGSDDSAKENDDSSHARDNSREMRKKGSKQKWVPVPIVPIPYRKRYDRGSGRQAFESARAASSCSENEDRKNENENLYSSEYRRGNGRFRGRRGRGFSHSFKSRRDEKSRSDNESVDKPSESQSSMYYDPHLHSQYAALNRTKYLKKALKTQIEYYFSEENLVKDFFMRRRMDAMGYVPLTLVASFHRVKNLTTDYSVIVEAVNESDKLDVLNDVKLRPVVDPLKWPIQDFNGLRPDVPDFIPGQPYFSISSIVDCMQNCSLFSAEEVYEEDASDEVVNVSDVPFDEVMQSGFAVSAT